MSDEMTSKSAAIESIEAVSEKIPAVIIIHDMKLGFTVEYMSQRGLDILRVSMEELKEMGQEYYNRFFNAAESEQYILKMQEFISRNDLNEVYTNFQQVRASENEEWAWYLCSTRILLRDQQGMPWLTTTLAVQIDPDNHVTNKVNRVIEENNFLKENLDKYAELSKREKEILQLIALSKSNKEIADQLNISVSTTETHRKNIKRKLDVQSNAELNLFARAFDLI